MEHRSASPESSAIQDYSEAIRLNADRLNGLNGKGRLPDYGSPASISKIGSAETSTLTDRGQEPMRAENFLRLKAANPITTLANSSAEVGSGTALVPGIVIEVKVADCEVLLA